MPRLALLLLMALPAQAQDAPIPAALSALPDVLPDALADRLRRAPDAFVEDAAGLILGYGSGGAITAAGIATYIQTVEAAERGNVLRRMVEADLDADGTIAASEVAVVAGAAEAGVRGRIMMNHAAADADGDGAVTWPEARARADALALGALSAAERERLGGMMALDLNGDGALTLAEVQEVARLMQGQLGAPPLLPAPARGAMQGHCRRDRPCPPFCPPSTPRNTWPPAAPSTSSKTA